jgi:hypothetical protein
LLRQGRRSVLGSVEDWSSSFGERMSDNTISGAVNFARSITPMTTGWPASTGVAPDQPGLHQSSPGSPCVTDVRRTRGQTIAQRAAAELGAVGERAAAHSMRGSMQVSPAHPQARHSAETMPKASTVRPAASGGQAVELSAGWAVPDVATAGHTAGGVVAADRAPASGRSMTKATHMAGDARSGVEAARTAGDARTGVEAAHTAGGAGPGGQARAGSAEAARAARRVVGDVVAVVLARVVGRWQKLFVRP